MNIYDQLTHRIISPVTFQMMVARSLDVSSDLRLRQLNHFHFPADNPDSTPIGYTNR